MFGLSSLLDCGGDVKGNIDSRMPPEDAELTWVLEDGDAGGWMSGGTGVACGEGVGVEGENSGEWGERARAVV